MYKRISGISKSLKEELDEIDSSAGLLTGVYIPPSVKPAKTVNVIFYIHGDKVRVGAPRAPFGITGAYLRCRYVKG